MELYNSLIFLWSLCRAFFDLLTPCPDLYFPWIYGANIENVPNITIIVWSLYHNVAKYDYSYALLPCFHYLTNQPLFFDLFLPSDDEIPVASSLQKKTKLKDSDINVKSMDMDAEFDIHLAAKFKKVHKFSTPLPTTKLDWIK